MSNLQDDFEARLRVKKTFLGITKPVWVYVGVVVLGVVALMALSGAFGTG
jgi:hypothetical protein